MDNEMQIIFVSNSPELSKNIHFTNNLIIYIRHSYIFSNTMLKNVKFKSNDGLVYVAKKIKTISKSYST